MDEIAVESEDRNDPVDTYLRLERWPSPPEDVGGGEAFLVGFVIVNVVGLSHYEGTISSRELVGLVREETNPFDRNAIKVLNMRSVQVGYIERSAAAVLSPLIDGHTITIEGIVPKPPGKRFAFKLPCQVQIFSRMEDIDRVKSAVENGGLQLISEVNPAITLSESMEVKDKKSVPAEKSVDEIFNLLELKVSREGTLAELEPPEDIITSKLFPYQKEGLGWLVSRENSVELPPFWVEKNGSYVNELTNYRTSARPEPLRGGIFADDMGLGKTLTLLSLIAFDKWIQIGNQPNNTDAECNEDEESISLFSRKSKRGRGSRKADSSKRKRKSEDLNDLQDTGKRLVIDERLSLEPKTTLVVCTPSVLSTWITQLEQHTRKGKLKVYMYYGLRTRDANELLKFDIVLTTYSTLGSEETFFESPIHKIEWRRVILDEAHVIKNVEAKLTRAVIALNSKRRWAVTGTPVQNNSFDLYSLVAFLKFEPLSVKKFWESLIERPLAHGNEKGISRLQVLIAAISLRRTKDTGLVGLPSKTIETLYVDLNEEERRVYDQMEIQAKDIVASYVSIEGVVRNYYTVLSVLVRLRQICIDLALCPAEIRDILPPSQIEDVKNNPTLLQKLLSMLQDDEDFDCPICISPPTDIVITCCAHVFCQSCILKTLKRSKACCPMCRNPLSESDLFKNVPESSGSTSSESSSVKSSSSKVTALLKLLSAAKNAKPFSKSIIFSQFRKMLLLLEAPLKEAGFKVIRLDGTMNARRRANVIKEFSIPAPEGPTILLASLKASNAGINLTAASTVYLLEPWWNPAIEEQAMDRVHRIGQTDEVKVVKLIARNTIEERILQLQEKKRTLAKKAFSRGPKDKKEISKDDLSVLMNL